ncbi:predicted protein [Sclerotinia sclerotiorum 1980 UF-70]|uniref:Uncharacterized protein n=1 Tax=Sclerotinia sclerotiorum (strain ATCC 18683 / 1980 / Ss-1) TaxID=665079 RepID=A7EJH6_SCLS1|nr:predicted protein [Sclerotinia sclerotiorum 1980 UF-70]EDO02992.1 predicted protein [Sclerotinia sclerotiorum 1980 UF-70]
MDSYYYYHRHAKRMHKTVYKPTHLSLLAFASIRDKLIPKESGRRVQDEKSARSKDLPRTKLSLSMVHNINNTTWKHDTPYT